ncbi:terpenoid synthase [Pholiota conissans]|uniref:Terpenoid synthase n=1 Tax=Pholiota conissans TaxID=109636 RepID=A0A9P6CYZ3_9AGAR|nr:terpenoid synthase [Pholiota conissans]
MSSNQSFQLPDLLNIISPLELRTNPNCRFATDASEKWISTEIRVLSETERGSLRAAKIGLLAGLCFPTCDAPQLRLLVDFMTLAFYSAITARDDPEGRGWWDIETPNENVSPDSNAENIDPESGINILARHALFKHAVHPQITRLAKEAPAAWTERFARSVRSFRTAQEQLLLRDHSADPKATENTESVDSYVASRRDLYGSRVVLGIAELLEVVDFPGVLEPEGSAAGAMVLALEELQRAAFDIIAWSTDVVSYTSQRGQSSHLNLHRASPNLVAVLMKEKHLSVQGAMNVCGHMIRGAFSAFSEAEQRVLELAVHKPREASVFARVFSSLQWSSGEDSTNAATEEQEAVVVQTQRYIRALKDCIVGTVHWIYETELFFGKKGSEIRNFGWIFVDQAPDNDM